MTILTNFIKRENLDPKDTLISLKRMNRVLPNFFDEVSQVVNANMLEDPEVIIELLEVKFSLLTTINTIIFLTKVCDFYIPDPTVKEKYEELHSDLLVIYENPNLYSKASYTSIYNFINDKYITFIKPTDNHTKFRNFLLLSLLILELPLKLSLLTDIGYVGYEGCDYHDTLKFKVAIINKNNKLSLVVNKNTIAEQIIYHFESNVFIRLLRSFITTHLINYKCLFSAANGKGITKSNISNGLVNYTKKEFGYPIGINDCNRLWKNWYKKQNDTAKLLLLTTINN